jgi:antitoxin component YwqK of YwqJK toxin-antitoxin module
VPWTAWREDGSKWATGTIVDLQDQGAYEEWHANGQPAAEGVYEKGQKVGDWRYWDLDGNPSTTPQGDLDR